MKLVYLLTITVSNLLTARCEPFVLADGALIIPVGSVLVGAVFVLRDLIQMKHGRADTYTVIARATVLSMALCIITGETAHVAVASLAAFLASEVLDTEVFTRMRGNLIGRILLSGTVGGALDSIIFVVLGLSPIGAGVLPWSLVPAAVSGQVVTKLLLQFVAAGWLILRSPERKTKP